MKIIQTACDRHYQEQDKVVDAMDKPTAITLDKKVMLADLCTDCRAELEAALAPFLAVARRPEAAEPTATRPTRPRGVPALPTENLVCSCGREFATLRGLTRHMNFPGEGGAGQTHEQVAA